MAQPYNQSESHPALGKLDHEHGEFWMRNPWDDSNENLSAYERNRVLWNLGGQQFADISHLTTADLDSDSRAVAVGDFNQDGMPDVIVQSVGGGPLRVFENQWPHRHWLRVSLRGTKSNRLGLGARLKLEAGGRVQWRELYPVMSYRSQLPSSVLFGLGDAEHVDRLTVYWPSGEVQNVEQMPVNRRVRITEGDASFKQVSAKEISPTILPIPSPL